MPDEIRISFLNPLSPNPALLCVPISTLTNSTVFDFFFDCSDCALRYFNSSIYIRVVIRILAIFTHHPRLISASSSM
jgi:hypothetical protein